MFFIQGKFDEYNKFFTDLLIPLTDATYFEYWHQKNRKYENNLKSYCILEISEEHINKYWLRKKDIDKIEISILNELNLKPLEEIQVWVPSKEKLEVSGCLLDSFIKNPELENWFSNISKKYWLIKDNL